jgi:UDP-N-acetylmuramyl pentapeptide phosphotransferase/UDP-N-acetylglucosamine-1-phosphate transferase
VTVVLVVGTLLSSAVLATSLLAVTPRLLRRLALYDVPTSRSSHDRPVLRGAGIAVAAAIASVLLAASAAAATTDAAAMRTVAGTVALFAVLGFVEDQRGLSVGARLRWQGGLATLVGATLSAVTSSWWLWLPGALLIVAYVNVTNFMDGINSISALHGAVGGASLAVLGLLEHQWWLVAAGSAGAGAFAAFLPWNGLGRVTYFLGDVGSYALGGFLAVCVAGAVMAGVRPWPVLSILSVYVLDVGLTLLRRLRAGEDVTLPHREHVYQRLTGAGLGHVQVGILVSFCTLSVVLAGLAGASSDRLEVVLLCAGVQAAVLAGYAVLPRALDRLRPAGAGSVTAPAGAPAARG